MRVDIAGELPGRIHKGVLRVQRVFQCVQAVYGNRRDRGREHSPSYDTLELRMRIQATLRPADQHFHSARELNKTEDRDDREVARLRMILESHEQHVARG